MAGGKAQEVKFALDDSFTQPVCDHSVGFLRFTRIDGIEFAEPAGTGIFAKLGKTYGILTAGHVLNPIATNEAIGPISALSSAGIIQGDLDMDGRSSIKDRDVGEAIGEYFFGS